MSHFASLSERCRTRFLKALRSGRARRRNPERAISTERLEVRALLSGVNYSAATQLVEFTGEANEANGLIISSAGPDSLILQSSEVITLMGDAVGNPGFDLDGAGTTLTIDITAAGSIVTMLDVDTADQSDTIEVEATPATVSLSIDGGSENDTIDVGRTFTLDPINSAITVDGGTGSDILNVLDFLSMTPDPDIIVTDDRISGMSVEAIEYDGFERLFIDTVDTRPIGLNILSTAAGAQTDFDLTFQTTNGDGSINTNDAVVTIGNTDTDFQANLPGNLVGVAGDISLDFNSGRGTLQVDDSGDASGDTATISDSTIIGLSQGDIAFAGANPLFMFEVRAGAGNDNIDLVGSVADHQPRVRGGAGNDSIDASTALQFNDDRALRLFGDDGNDLLIGNDSPNLLHGGSGNDELRGRDGKDDLIGGMGNDLIDGGAGADEIEGSDGDDILEGGNGTDRIIGGLGTDMIDGGRGDDLMIWNNGDGSDIVVGGRDLDKQVVNGSDAGDDFFVEERLGSVVFERTNLIPFELDLTEIEVLDVRSGLGNDSLTVMDLTGTDLDALDADMGDGDDLLDAGGLQAGLDTLLEGGAGNDQIIGSMGDDRIKAGAGMDVVIGGRGNDELRGNEDDDLFIWNNGDGSDDIFGGSGRDTQEVNGAAAGDDFVITTPGDIPQLARTNLGLFALSLDIEVLDLNTGNGDDTVNILDIPNRPIIGLNVIDVALGQGTDHFDATNMERTIPLFVNGGAGTDHITGGPGDDFLRGADGNDRINGKGGDDELVGDDGRDQLTGGTGNDEMFGGGGADLIRGKAGDDYAHGGGAADRIFGDEGNDFLLGSSGADELDGGADNDILSGGNGPDVLNGSSGNDFLIGGNGQDQLNGGGGQDIVIGGVVMLTQNGLQNVMDEWLSDRDYKVRRDNMVDGSGSPDRNNGSSFLMPITRFRTVLDDSADDLLTGGNGRDLFFAKAGNDFIDDMLPSETKIDLL